MHRMLVIGLMTAIGLGCGADPDRGDGRKPPKPPEISAKRPPREGKGKTKPPVAKGKQPVNPAVAVEEQQFAVVRVFYGTDRRPTGDSKPSEFYGHQQSDLQVGFCDVSIPADHEEGELESPVIWKLEFREDPQKHVVVLNVQPTAGQH